MRELPLVRVRVVVMVSAALAALIRGAGYLVNPPGAGLTALMSGLLPVTAWGWAWVAGAVVVLVGFWWRPVGRYALAFLACMWFMWGVSYMLAGVTDSRFGLATGAGMVGYALTLGAAGFVLARLEMGTKAR